MYIEIRFEFSVNNELAIASVLVTETTFTRHDIKCDLYIWITSFARCFWRKVWS